jgi:DNA polymerase (family 10)/putative hydrolase
MRKKWEKYKKFLKTGAWHIHTNFTDGKNSVFEYCEKAKELGIPLIGFTEHVRKKIEYNFKSLKKEIEEAKKKFNLKIILGCEAKVLDKNGNLDASKKILKESEIVLGVFHGTIFKSKEDFFEALKNLIKNPYLDVWAHPGLFYLYQNFNLSKGELVEITKLCARNKVLIEINLKYNLPEKKLFCQAKKNKAKFIYGLDAHSIGDLELLKDSNKYSFIQ